ncbi:MAG: ATP synthase F1 subunit epsilon [Acidimicrobiaceae bacterium]|nr:ATP synthase F1 subunit epsilon [Acidimicrobiaceae bacterium]
MLNVQVVSPESVSYTGEASVVVARTVEGGDIAFQPGHIPFIGILQVWSVDVVKDDGSRDTFAVHRGFVQVSDTDITILSDVSEAKDEIDVPRAEQALAEAEQALLADADDSGAASDKARAKVRIRVAAGE